MIGDVLIIGGAPSRGKTAGALALMRALTDEARLLLWLREVERVQGLVEGGRQDLAPRLGLRQRYVTRLAESFTMREVAA